MSKPFLSELSLEEHKAYERLVEVMPREFEKLGALCDAANVAVRDSARQALTFFLNQDILSVARPVDHAAASKAIAAWLNTSIHISRPSFEFLAYCLRRLCALSRRATPLAIKAAAAAAEAEAEQEEDEDTLICLGGKLADALSLSGPECTDDVRTFVSTGGWDAIAHLLVHPPPDRIFHKAVGGRPPLSSCWAKLWETLADASQLDEATNTAIRHLGNQKECEPCDEYKFPYPLPNAPAAADRPSGVTLIQARTRGGLLLDVAAVLATEGSFHDAKPAIKFLYMYFYGTLKHHKIEAAGRALSGRLLEQVRRQLLALREAPLDGKTTGYPEERGEEAALGRLHAHAAVLLQLLLALRWACLQPRVADSPEIAEALLALFFCGARDDTTLTTIGYCLLDILIPENGGQLAAQSWHPPSCFHRSCVVHRGRTTRRRREAAGTMPGWLLPLFVGAIFRSTAASRAGQAEELHQLGHSISGRGYELIGTLHKSGTARDLRRFVVHMGSLPATPGGGPSACVGLLPGAKTVFRQWFRAYDITVEDDVLFGKHGGALASETLEAEACAGTCGNPICESTDGELQRCGKCRRIRYCSRDCQRLHWPLHKEICKALTKAAELPLPTPPPRS